VIPATMIAASFNVLATGAQVPAGSGDATLGGAPGAELPFWIVALALLSLAPFVLAVATPFAKFVIIGSVLRQAFGMQQVPPASVTTALALILSIHVMSPVIDEASSRYQRVVQDGAGGGAGSLDAGALLTSIREPLREFLQRNADPRAVAAFQEMKERVAARQKATRARGQAASQGAEQAAVPAATEPQRGSEGGVPALVGWKEDLTVLVPAFMITELSEAFVAGFLLYLPFLVIDLVVSSILLAAGAQSLQPNTITPPLKLLLFVAADGWRLLMIGLVLGYQ